MNNHDNISYPYVWHNDKIYAISFLLDKLNGWREEEKKIVSTNGCFDLLHAGHVYFLNNARKKGDVLIVGLNSDSSVNRLKGAGRPILPEKERAAVISAFRAVDLVVIFDDLLPNNLLKLIKPNLHCKAADYTIDSMPEAELVQSYGGEISILPMIENISTSRIIDQIHTLTQETDYFKPAEGLEKKSEIVFEYFSNAAMVLKKTAFSLEEQIIHAAEIITEALLKGKKILLCGNGGSASDAQHMAAELVGRFRLERNALPAISLSADTAVLTAVSNDFGFEQVFARQVSALGNSGDVLIAISTSGLSVNVLEAAIKAKEKGLFVIGITGDKRPNFKDKCDICLSVPSNEIVYIQQAHSAILHIICFLVEKSYFKRGKK